MAVIELAIRFAQRILLTLVCASKHIAYSVMQYGFVT